MISAACTSVSATRPWALATDTPTTPQKTPPHHHRKKNTTPPPQKHHHATTKNTTTPPQKRHTTTTKTPTSQARRKKTPPHKRAAKKHHHKNTSGPQQKHHTTTTTKTTTKTPPPDHHKNTTPPPPMSPTRSPRAPAGSASCFLCRPVLFCSCFLTTFLIPSIGTLNWIFFPSFSRSGVAQWLACWAHNPKVPGLKPGPAMFVLTQNWPILHTIYSIRPNQ